MASRRPLASRRRVVAEILRVDSAARAFAGRRVLHSATLRAHAGRVTALLGRNGAGKSTLLKIAAGVVSPDPGVVHFLGHAYLRASHATLARHGLFFWPADDALSPALTVGTQLAMMAARFGGDAVAAAERAGIAHRVSALPPELSGGERRRAELALALVRRPVCLLADEPFRDVAPRDAEHLVAALRVLSAEGCAVVVTGHEVETLLAVADTVAWCTAGTTYELGPPGAARLDARFAREYLSPRASA